MAKLFLKFCQRGEILPNLVTLISERKTKNTKNLFKILAQVKHTQRREGIDIMINHGVG